ncbi:hypothetical protein K493DRAFT_372559 [Basidiobolus meristosporus CBS 931.73]|uniref:3D domain-containing protein n=1 Tax=Basidiobolus meristosporus CBS 931.73 TaxID=1314790 RepID=A0A1Y1YBF7_9FUNG|nr:hypothetical protein K493DRAFT_309577 [Basidiobolus meristosporus CBS 931.73]ORX95245.1 hypothetical protein K493DRAFT_301606 [Basidiobolus meristosporus CBS 931.73]ORX95246.1 hypothetical protein K493DRAFT_372559 [Basidiobolus meristosporus CBS 931.73]|eukprot:ORX64400.1 hypothetical protein K493DRAFT_309577 [Basidiobolus meristosporus CBS 931.73]
MLSTFRFLLVATLGVTMLGASVFAKKVKMTYYWISEESDFSGPKDVHLRSCSGEVLATVSRQFASAARMEGTAILGNGKVINLQCDCNGGYSCFSFINEKLYPFGLGEKDNALVPFVSVAANDISYGTTLMVEQLKGIKLPNGQIHNGCVRVDDQGWSFGDNQIDFMVGIKKYYVEMDNKYGNLFNYVDITREECTPGVYKTPRD